MNKSRTILAAAVLIGLGCAPAPAVAQGCLSGSEGRQVLEQGQAMPLPEAMRRAGVSGQVIDAQLCGGGGGYVYRVRIRQDDGEIRSLNIPAG